MNTQEKDYWERRFDELFPNGLTQEQADEANREMWKELPEDGNTLPHDCKREEVA